jgi:hypothetical protein
VVSRAIGPSLLRAAVLAGFVAGCGSSAPTPTPPPTTTPTPLPTPTPDRHITGPVDTDRVFQILLAAGIPVHQESLGPAGPNGEPVTTLYVVGGSVHIAIRQYTTAAAVAAAGFRSGSAIAIGDAPFEIWASNVVLDIGPMTPGARPDPPDPAVGVIALAVATALDPYLGPLSQRALTPLTLPSAPVPATPGPSPSPSPRPSSRPSP